jgi:hypothetical protein
MMLSKGWRSGTAFSMGVAIASAVVLPFVAAQSASATVTDRTLLSQRFPDSWRNSIPSGTMISTDYEKDKIIVMPDETSELELSVVNDIATGGGRVLIPAGSKIKGELKPTNGGTQFVAKELKISGESAIAFDATSDVITRRETIRKRSNPDFLKGAAIGAAAAAVLAEVLGDIDVIEVLGGAGIGALGSVIFRGRREVEVISVDPSTDLTLMLQDDFTRVATNPTGRM